MVLLQTLAQEARDDLTKITDVPSIYRVQGAANTCDQIMRWIVNEPFKIPVEQQE